MNQEQIREDERALAHDRREAPITLEAHAKHVRVSQDPGTTNITAERYGTHGVYFVTVDSRHGEVLANNVPVGSTEFRRLVKAARRHL